MEGCGCNFRLYMRERFVKLPSQNGKKSDPLVTGSLKTKGWIKMKRKFSASLLVMAVVFSMVGRISAQEEGARFSPFMLSFVNPIQVPPADFDIGGLKLNLIYGESHGMIGLDIGLFSQNTGDVRALHINGVSVVGGNGRGLMISLIANYVEGEYGGLQIGAYNHATHLDGLQIGVINYANTAYGLQIGLINVIEDNDLPFLPIINGYF